MLLAEGVLFVHLVVIVCSALCPGFQEHKEGVPVLCKYLATQSGH